ncbi:MAG: DUF5050 domain-containing protein, partial [Anaerolineae bacterium]|nr:DUF5050 domain-containing protein [Anaerolineae bacterium]
MRKSSGLLFLLIVILIVVGPWSLHAAPPNQATTPIIIDQPDAAATVYWTETALGTIRNGNADGSGSASTCKSNEANPRGLVVSAETGRIYWVERDAGRLRRANLDCSGAMTIGPKLIDPDRLALDVEGGKIYWTENQSDTTTSNRIRRANLDGTGAETILTGLNAPVGIAVDHANDYLYWTEYGGDSIWRSSLTGANKQQILKLGKGAAPLEIALDVEGNRIYWLSPSSGGIFSATLNGENAGLWLAADTPRSMAIDISAGKLYWADQGSKEIRRINLDGTGNQLLYNSADGVDRPLGVGLLITAAPSCYTLTRTHTGNGGDPTATPNKSSGCDAGKYIAGESITLTAASDDGWRVKNWSGTNNDAGTSTTNTVTMPAAN